MKTALLHSTAPEEIAGVVEVMAKAVCRFNFVSSDGVPEIIEGEQCEELCDYCLTKALYVLHHIIEHQKEATREQ